MIKLLPPRVTRRRYRAVSRSSIPPFSHTFREFPRVKKSASPGIGYSLLQQRTVDFVVIAGGDPLPGVGGIRSSPSIVKRRRTSGASIELAARPAKLVRVFVLRQKPIFPGLDYIWSEPYPGRDQWHAARLRLQYGPRAALFTGGDQVQVQAVVQSDMSR